MANLNGKNVIITGAAGGLGGEIARAAAAAGAAVAIFDVKGVDRKSTRLNSSH